MDEATKPNVFLTRRLDISAAAAVASKQHTPIHITYLSDATHLQFDIELVGAARKSQAAEAPNFVHNPRVVACDDLAISRNRSDSKF